MSDHDDGVRALGADSFSEVEVVDENQQKQFDRLVGARIICVERVLTTNETFSTSANGVTVHLDNGLLMIFGSWGYDADGTLMWIKKTDSALGG